MMSSSPKKHILTISRDESLQRSRTLLLEHIGYRVTPLGSNAAVIEFLAAASKPYLDLVLMCHSVPEASRVTLCDALKAAYPQTPILMLYNGYDPTAAKVDGRIENTDDPKRLVDGLTLLLRP